MARNTKAKKKKAPKLSSKALLDEAMKAYAKEIGEPLYCLTQSAIEEIKQEAIRITMKSSASLLEYNMILENHLTPTEAKRQSKLMDIRAEAIINGHLSWEEVDTFLEEHYAKEMEMAINSKEKGKRFERDLAKKFREYGYSEARRTAQYCGNTGDASDVVGLPGIHVEAKAVEKMYLYDWMAQAKRDAKDTGNLPAVFHKKNRAAILVTMELKDFMELYREWEAAQK